MIITYIKIDYFKFGEKLISFGSKRNDIREVLDVEYEIEDQVISFGDGEPPMNIKRDVYQDSKFRYYFFLNYDNDDFLEEIEVHYCEKIILPEFEINFHLNFNDLIRKMMGNYNTKIISEGEILLLSLNMVMASDKKMGGESENLSYVYFAKNINHLME